ncbi:crotonase/enoyl-CoA hydratase family protein [Shinella curvata]|uniref:Crotonase/enoyl-CoA hydratase family protein n=1 Tax=Shinella curvata TaxID=1817964 RepID=A0ABT8XBS1_9HYPH|nr:crotonase/enoyl-CoA hydratase family protein [Shinella curvata]MCJ8054104.1 crotonase/enoyl-CoA hydratase family protein [Shinella curvata]MDO6121126.1 crotonase/enoyl-CoA hydratase family protein [Shinella curvata]
MNFETISVSVDRRGVAALTLRRHAQHNALSGLMIRELTAVAGLLGGDRAVRVVVLTGEGESFCAGGDLNWMKEQIAASREARIAEARRLALMLKALRDLHKPLIARVNGQAYGGGVGLISVCDAAIAVEGARFGLTETRLGLIPATISPYVAARIGPAAFLRFATSARLFDAPTARDIGLIGGVVAPEALDEAIEAEIKPYFATSPEAVAATKALAHALASPIDDTVIEMTLTRLADTWETPEATEGIAAFLEKRKANWVPADTAK